MEEIRKELVPWQKRKELGFFKAWIETIKQVLFDPVEFFDNLKINKSILEPLYFSFLVAYPYEIINAIVKLAVKNELSLGMWPYIPIGALLNWAISIFLVTGFIHLSVLIYKGRGGFKGTFNVFAYGSAAYIPPSIIFIFGLLIGKVGGIGISDSYKVAGAMAALVGLIWIIRTNIIGLKEVHNFSTARAICSLLFNPLLMIVIIALLVAIAIPNLLTARRTANETVAKATISAISKALENYSTVNNGQYPLSEYDLKKGKFLLSSQYYSNNTVSGYTYSFKLRRDGYELLASPVTCGTTGRKVFSIQTNASLSEKDCK